VSTKVVQLIKTPKNGNLDFWDF